MLFLFFKIPVMIMFYFHGQKLKEKTRKKIDPRGIPIFFLKWYNYSIFGIREKGKSIPFQYQERGNTKTGSKYTIPLSPVW